MKDFRKLITDFHYGKKSCALYASLFLPSLVYAFVIRCKNFFYDIGLFKEKEIDANIICIGNLTTGGVGKTPVVIEFAQYYEKMGKKVCILTRGYKSDFAKGKIFKEKKALPTKVGNEILYDRRVLGDEAYLICKKTNNVTVILAKDRFFGAKCAKEEFGADVIIMDDGFSNRKLHKNINILLFDNKRFQGNGKLLPLGPLREPLSEIKRAQKVIFVNKGDDENFEIKKFKEKLKIPHFDCKMQAGKIYNIKTGEILDKGAKIFAFCGIGSPEQFYNNLKEYELMGTKSFDDHFEYTKKDVDEISSLCIKSKAQAVITTEKDMVKIAQFEGVDNFYAMDLELKINLDEILG